MKKFLQFNVSKNVTSFKTFPELSPYLNSLKHPAWQGQYKVGYNTAAAKGIGTTLCYPQRHNPINQIAFLPGLEQALIKIVTTIF